MTRKRWMQKRTNLCPSLPSDWSATPSAAAGSPLTQAWATRKAAAKIEIQSPRLVTLTLHELALELGAVHHDGIDHGPDAVA